MEGEEWLGGRASKRRRVGNAYIERPITHPDHLEELLRFQQDVNNSPEPVNTFINFLKSIEDETNQDGASKSFVVLSKYCEQQRATSDEGITLPDLISTWSFSIQSGNDAATAAVLSTFARLLRIISSSIDLRQFGLSLIDSLLRPEQIQLFERSLGVGKSKDFLILPSLDLLAQLVSFDGGARLSALWLRKETFFRRLDAFLDDQTLRAHALPILEALIKLADATSTTQKDLLSHGRALQALLKGLPQDSEDQILNFVSLINKHLVQGREFKAELLRFFNPTRLGYLAILYKRKVDDEETPLRLSVHDLLLRLCTTDEGILLRNSGWFPPSAPADRLLEPEDDTINLGLESPAFTQLHASNILVKNNTLALFLHKLHPEDDPLQTDLLLKTFTAAQELVAPYFAKHGQFSVPIDDTIRWRAQFACYFSVIQLPVPPYFGGQHGINMRPPSSVVAIEHILPKPFDAALIRKLLASDDEVQAISGARLLTVALQKLDTVVGQLSGLRSSSPLLFSQAIDSLSSEFSSRIPKPKDLANMITGDVDVSRPQYTALLECLAMCYRVIPDTATVSAFDISRTLTATITALERESSHSERRVLFEQLNHCIDIATTSNSTRWTTKADADTLSPLMRVLRLTLTNETTEIRLDMTKPVSDVLLTQGLLHCTRSFQALRTSLSKDKKFEPSDDVFQFVDNCIYQAGKKSVHYVDRIEEAQRLVSDRKPLSIVAASVSDQWQHTLNKYSGNKDVLKNISSWIARFFSLLDYAGENYRVMMKYQESMLHTSGEKARSYLEKSLDRTRKKSLLLPEEPAEPSSPEVDHEMDASSGADVDLIQIFGGLPQTPNSLLGLNKWPPLLDLESEIRSGRLSRLIRCISAPEYEVRIQALQTVQSVAHSVDLSSHESKGQIYLLLGELCETVRQHDLQTPLPLFVPELANSILTVLADPAHEIYGKVNKFLLRSPEWNLKRLVPYWTEKTILTRPESYDDDAWNTEMSWFLDWIVAGLGEKATLEHYRKSNVIEQVLSLYFLPQLSQRLKHQILALIWGCMEAEGGYILRTRYGLNGWFKSALAIKPEDRKILEALQREMENRVDKTNIKDWESGRRLFHLT